jgi:hypothetical protein
MKVITGGENAGEGLARHLWTYPFSHMEALLFTAVDDAGEREAGGKIKWDGWLSRDQLAGFTLPEGASR